MTLQTAYELLMGRAGGKEATDHSDSNSWSFHDWYWSFRVQRSWGSQQEGGSAARSAAPGYQEPEAKKVVASQLAGLRHRAAVRRTSSGATGSRSSSPQAQPRRVCEGEGERDCAAPYAGGEFEAADAAPLQTPTPAHAEDETASRWSPRRGHQPQQQKPPVVVVVDGHFGTSIFSNAVPFNPPTMPSAAAPAAPAPGQQQQQLVAATTQGEEEERRNAAQQAWQQARRRPFVPSSDKREGVMSQLEGLRRKATFKAATAPKASAPAS